MYGLVPPLTVKSMIPVAAPKHNTFVTPATSCIADGCIIVALVVAVHPFVSVTITL